MATKNYSFYSSSPFKYNFKWKFQSSIQNAKEQELWTILLILFIPLLLRKELSPVEIWDKRNGNEQQLITKLLKKYDN